MTTRASLTQRPAIYDDDLLVRIDAAMARTQRFINSTQAVRADVRSPYDAMPGVHPTNADRRLPPCPKCNCDAAVPLHAVRLRKGARCYACKKCGHVFGASAEEETRTTDADRGTEAVRKS